MTVFKLLLLLLLLLLYSSCNNVTVVAINVLLTSDILQSRRDITSLFLCRVFNTLNGIRIHLSRVGKDLEGGGRDSAGIMSLCVSGVTEEKYGEA